MASETASTAGFATAKTVSHYSNLTKSGAGLIFVEYTYVHLSGRSEANQLGIQSDAHIEGLKKIAQTIHASGSLAGIQLTHAGAKTSRDLTGGFLMGPSSVPVPVKDRQLESPDPMSLSEIELWREAFLMAAKRAQDAGFDVIEFHSAHGYGLNQWLSPITNQRTDVYGGSIGRNARILFEIVEDARRKYPNVLLAVRLPGQDFSENGLTAANAIWIAQALENRGVDLIDVSSGISGWKRPSNRQSEGYLVQEASSIQAEVLLPVIGVGGIETGSFIDEKLFRQEFTLAAVGRAILKNPQDWGDINLRIDTAHP